MNFFNFGKEPKTKKIGVSFEKILPLAAKISKKAYYPITFGVGAIVFSQFVDSSSENMQIINAKLADGDIGNFGVYCQKTQVYAQGARLLMEMSLFATAIKTITEKIFDKHT